MTSERCRANLDLPSRSPAGVARDPERQIQFVLCAMTGPVGMFVGTTQMKFDTTLSDASGTVIKSELIAAKINSESESNVADHAAKKHCKALRICAEENRRQPLDFSASTAWRAVGE